MYRLLTALAPIVFAAPLLAQVGPGLEGNADAFSTFWDTRAANPPQLPNPGPMRKIGLDIGGFSAERLSGDPAGTWTVGLTMSGLSAMWGAAGTYDLVIGTYTPGNPVATRFKPTNYAAALNSSDFEWGLHLEPGQGRYAVFDRFRNNGRDFMGVYFAARANQNVPFGPPVRITNIYGLKGFSDPALGYVRNPSTNQQKLVLFYGGCWFDANQKLVRGILMADLDLTNLAQVHAVGRPTVVAAPVNKGWIPHSPSPITGADGDVEGLFLCELDLPNNVSDTYFADDLDPATPSVFVMKGHQWQNQSGLAGGELCVADGNYEQMRCAQAAWLVGDTEPVGQNPAAMLDVTVGASFAGTRLPAASVLFLSATPPINGVRIPGLWGLLGLTNLLGFGVQTHGLDHRATYSFQVPNISSLRGKSLYAQALAIRLAPSAGTFTNTAPLRFR